MDGQQDAYHAVVLVGGMQGFPSSNPYIVHKQPPTSSMGCLVWSTYHKQTLAETAFSQALYFTSLSSHEIFRSVNSSHLVQASCSAIPTALICLSFCLSSQKMCDTPPNHLHNNLFIDFLLLEFCCKRFSCELHLDVVAVYSQDVLDLISNVVLCHLCVYVFICKQKFSYPLCINRTE